MFKDNINRICRERNTFLTTVIKQCGASSSKVTAINTGSIPNEELMITLSNALNCSVMDFFVDDEDLLNAKEKPHLNEDEEDILRIYNQLDRVGQHKLMSAIYEFDIKE